MAFRRTEYARDANYGNGSHALSSSECNAVLNRPAEVATLVRSLLRSPGYQPPRLPAAAMEIHRLSMKPRVDFAAVVDVLEGDQLLASEALRIAQSASYARAVPPASLRDAVQRLGMNNVRDIVMRAAMTSKVFRAKQYESAMESVRKHSVATGVVARLLAKGSPVGEYAYMCGLLHDVGAAAVLLALADAKRDVPLELLGEVVEELHEEAGMAMLEAWKLPPNLAGAIGNHHHPTSKEGALALIAHTVASECGFGVFIGGPIETERPERTKDACKLLRLTPEGLDKLREQAAAALDEI
ncbi:MAG: HDOD domain-containing protein [Sandaracinaceae bacterium]